MPGDILTIQEAAELLKVSDRTIYTWRHREGFPGMKVGNTVRISRGQLMDWFNDQVKNRR